MIVGSALKIIPLFVDLNLSLIFWILRNRRFCLSGEEEERNKNKRQSLVSCLGKLGFMAWSGMTHLVW